MDFTTYEIFQTREVSIKRTREVGKSQGFMIIIKKSDGARYGKRGRISLSCERSGKYKGKEVKFNRKNTSEQQRSKCTGTKKYDYLFLLKDKELSNEEGWMIFCGVHNRLASEHLEGHSFASRLSEEEEKLIVNMSRALFGQEIFCIC